jgi:predicted metal-dependent hydrolase
MLTPNIDEIIYSRRKTIALIVQPNGKVIVRAPLHTSQRIITEFVKTKYDWLEDTLARVKKKQTSNPTLRYEEGGLFWYLGKQYPLSLVSTQTKIFSFRQGFFLKKDHFPQVKSIFKKWYKQEARSILCERTQYYAQNFGFAFKKIKITSAKTRWGSYSTRGSINFTWRLVMAPLEIIDYVIIHELVHTKILNHSQKFWNQVEQYLPDYRKRRLWLKKNGILFQFD